MIVSCGEIIKILYVIRKSKYETLLTFSLKVDNMTTVCNNKKIQFQESISIRFNPLRGSDPMNERMV